MGKLLFRLRKDGWKNKEMRELLGRGRFTFGAGRGKTQCMARPEPRDEVPLDPWHAEIERCELFPSFGKDDPSQI